MTRARWNTTFCLCASLASLTLGATIPRPAYATNGIMTINQTTTLTANHVGQIRFGANNITLDCAGHQISYSARQPSGSCGVSGTQTCGIHSLNRTGITIRNCDVVGAYNYGVWIQGTSTTSTVRDSSVTEAGVGFRVDSSSNLQFFNSAAVSNNAGFEIRDSTNVTFTGTDAVYSSGDGFDINDSTNTRIQYGFVFANGVNGIEFDFSPGSAVLNSEVLNNGQHGVSLDDGTGAYISSNLIRSNMEDGLRLQNSDNGTLRYNQVDYNGACNANQDAASTGNTWTGNTLQGWCGTVPNPH
ncbi:MAG: right-handed parallel beta-helix repeat-containing protein [Rhodanobacteraceae bacterium]|nr:right-handed parallel beta-helix repeat-containing protein [Rhodanobacteraceae bacterium]